MKHDPVRKGPANKGSHKKGPPPKRPEKEDGMKRYYDLGALAIIILLGIIIYSNSFDCSFHFDDLRNIVNNPKIQNLSDVKAIWNFSPNRPVPVFTFALNYHFNRLNMPYWHLVNVIIHLINACLVWWLTLLIFSSPALKDHKIIKYKRPIAIFTALLFVSHPLATQSVTYIVQRMTSMVALFYLLSLSLYIKARMIDKWKTSTILLFAGSLISAVLAMLSKENAFTLPFAILLVELFFIRTKNLSINFRDYRVILLMAAILGMILIIPLNYSFNIFNALPPSPAHKYTLTPLNYFLTQFSVIVKYIQLLFLPINQMVDYDFPISGNFFEFRTLLCFLVLLFLIVLAVLMFKRNRIISFGITWFFLTLMIESSFIPINDVIFEHRTYLPSFGFFLILSSGVYGLLREKYKFLAMSFLVVIIGSNAYLTFERNKVWKDEISLWSDNIAKAPNTIRPLSYRSYAYGILQQWDNSIADCSRAIEIDPNFAEAYYNRGTAYANLGQFYDAIADYSRAVDINPKYAAAYNSRGFAFKNLKEYNEAIADYTRAIGIDPNYADALYNRGNAYGSILQFNGSIADYTRAVEIDPNFAKAYTNRGNIYGVLQQWDKAITDYLRTIEIDPNNTEAYYNLGVAFGNLKEWDKAIAGYSQAIEIEPNYANAYYNRGTVFWNLKEWDKAIADYSKVIEIEPNNTLAYYYRGVIHGILQQWDQAVDDYSKVIEIDPDYSDAYSQRKLAYKNLNTRTNQ